MSILGALGVLNPVALAGNALALGEGLLNYKSQKDTNKANLELQDRANAANVALWREQSAYNTPIKQMQRLQEAGLNPQLAYGTLAESRAASAPQMAAPRYEAPRLSFADKLASYQQVQNLQTLNAKNNIDLMTAKAESVKAVSDAKYSVYENEMLMQKGLLKSDPIILRTWQRGLDLGTGKLGDFWKYLKEKYNPYSEEFNRVIELEKINSRR